MKNLYGFASYYRVKSDGAIKLKCNYLLYYYADTQRS